MLQYQYMIFSPPTNQLSQLRNSQIINVNQHFYNAAEKKQKLENAHFFKMPLMVHKWAAHILHQCDKHTHTLAWTSCCIVNSTDMERSL